MTLRVGAACMGYGGIELALAQVRRRMTIPDTYANTIYGICGGHTPDQRRRLHQAATA